MQELDNFGNMFSFMYKIEHVAFIVQFFVV